MTNSSSLSPEHLLNSLRKTKSLTLDVPAILKKQNIEKTELAYQT